MRNIYLGPRSCYARREGIYVKGEGVTSVRVAAGILYLLLRDLRRGWSYDHRCRKVRVTRRLFEERARFLAILAGRHGASGWVRAAIEKLVEYTLEHRRLPEVLRIGRRVLHPKRLAEEAIAEAG